MSKKVHVCIDLGNHTFKIGVFAKKGKKIILLKSLIEKTSFTIGESFKESASDIVNKISEMLKTLEVDARHATFYLSIPSQFTFCRLLKLPLVDKTKIHQMVQYEAQQQVPFSLDEVVWNYQVLGSPDPEHLHVILAAVRHELIQDLLTGLESQKIFVKLLEASPIASYRAFAKLFEGSAETAAVINLGARTTDLTVLAPHTLWIRTITVGGDHFTQEIQKEMKLGFQEAEDLKHSKAALPITPVPSPATTIEDKLKIASEAPAKRLLAELTRSIGYFNAQFHGHHISKVYLTGGESRLTNIGPYFSQKLSVPIENIDILQHPSLELAVPPDPNTSSSLTEVIGLGLRLLKSEKLAVNLLPKNYIARMASARRREMLFLSALTVLLILLFQIFYRGALVKLEQSRLNSIVLIQQDLKSYSDQIKNYIKEMEADSNHTREIRKLVREKTQWINIFEDLQKNTPQNIWITKLSNSFVQKPNMDMSVYSKSAPPGAMFITLFCKTTGTYKDVSDYRNTLEESPLFKDAQIRSANPPIQGVRDFVIQVEVEV
jgi:type IV pilus assembly protein PilM